MKIKETIERECCVPESDFIKIDEQTFLCKHCWQEWLHKRQPGEIEAGWYRGKSLKKLMDFVNGKNKGEQP